MSEVPADRDVDGGLCMIVCLHAAMFYDGRLVSGRRIHGRDEWMSRIRIVQ